MRNFIIGLIVGAVLMVSATALASERIPIEGAVINDDIKITIDGKELELEKYPVYYQHTNYMPLREIAEKVLEMDVEWVEETRTIELTTAKDTIMPVEPPIHVPFEHPANEGSEDVPQTIDEINDVDLPTEALQFEIDNLLLVNEAINMNLQGLERSAASNPDFDYSDTIADLIAKREANLAEIERLQQIIDSRAAE